VERGRPIAHDPSEQVPEEPGTLAQEGAFGLYASELVEEREGEDLRIGELLEGGVARCSPWVEMGVGVVDLAEQDAISASSRRADPAVCSGKAI
jgi:hypothetical protein